MQFLKYQHIERFGTQEVEGIEFGICHIFPKIDGTNGQIYFSDGLIKTGSRNRELSLDDDNQGFHDWVIRQENIIRFFDEFPLMRLYGEWLIPHTLKTYRDDAWRKFYVFDVTILSGDTEEYLTYEQYKPILDQYDIDYVPPIAIVNNPTYEDLTNKLDSNSFLIKDGCGFGEGIVIKNYAYKNKYGRVTWAKIVRNEFKDANKKVMGVKPNDGSKMTEIEFVDKYCNKTLIEKVYAKIANENGGWSSKYIPRLLQTVYYDLVNEETWNFIKEQKMPTINFRTLNFLTINKIKEIKPELF